MGSNQNDGTSVPQSEPRLCANGCGFFGTASSMNLCSKCYRDLRAEEERAVSAKAAMEKTLNINSKPLDSDFKPNLVEVGSEPVHSAAVLTESPSSSLVSGGDKPAETKPSNRCFVCNKKVALLGFKCRCGSSFCSTHRYPEKHNCDFDYRAAGRAEIASENPLVKADKVERI